VSKDLNFMFPAPNVILSNLIPHYYQYSTVSKVVKPMCQYCGTVLGGNTNPYLHVSYLH